MKKFFERYSYESVRLFLNQIAIGLFGVTLALAAGMAENTALRVVTSIFAILFFLILQYSVMWKVGANDRLADDFGKHSVNYSVPLKMWLLANSLNFLLALFIALGIWFEGALFLDKVGGVSAAVKLVIEGMYTGILAVKVGGEPLNSYWFMHFATPLPALAVCYLAYFLGTKNFKVFRSEGKKKDASSKVGTQNPTKK